MLRYFLADGFFASLFYGSHFSGFSVPDMFGFALLAFFFLKFTALLLRRKRERAAKQKAAAASKAKPTAGKAKKTKELDIDESSLLREAEKLFVALQQAWDERDFTTLAQMTTAPVLQELQLQAENEQDADPTEILFVQARLVASRKDGESEWVSIFFDALTRDDADSPSVQVKEIWRLSRPAGENAAWKLDGIEEVA